MNMRLALLFLVISGALAAAAHPPVSVVVDAQGNAYYSDLARVWKVAPNGAKSVAVDGVHTHELYLDAQGNLYGEHLWYEGERTDKWGHYVWRRSPDGRVVKVIPNREGFLENYSFVRDAAGNMYFANDDRKHVRKRLPDGRITVIARGFRNIRWMTATPNGTVFLIDRRDLVRVAPNGTVTRLVTELAKRTIFNIPLGPDHSIMGLWTDRAGNVFAAVASDKTVRKIAPDGKVTLVLKSKSGWKPVGGTVAPNGDLLVLENSAANQVRLRRFNRSQLKY